MNKAKADTLALLLARDIVKHLAHQQHCHLPT